MSFNMLLGQVKNMNALFDHADCFNQALGAWDVSNVEDMSFMFGGLSSFNKPLSCRKVNRTLNMRSMFNYAEVSINH